MDALHCPACGYDVSSPLTHGASICPECGDPISEGMCLAGPETPWAKYGVCLVWAALPMALLSPLTFVFLGAIMEPSRYPIWAQALGVVGLLGSLAWASLGSLLVAGLSARRGVRWKISAVTAFWFVAGFSCMVVFFGVGAVVSALKWYY